MDWLARFCLVLLVLIIIRVDTIWGQQLNLMGHTGLLITPTAEFMPDQTLGFGYSYFNEKEPDYALSDVFEQEGSAGRVLYGHLTFLPFLETTIRLTKPYDAGQSLGLGDRSIFIRLKIMEEKDYRPAVVLGLHDLLSEPGAYFQSNYLVVTKSFRLPNLEEIKYQGSLGYGFRFDHARSGYLLGLFGGLQAQWKWCSLLLEYDAKQFNYGVKVNAFDHLFLQMALTQGRYVSAGANVSFNL